MFLQKSNNTQRIGQLFIPSLIFLRMRKGAKLEDYSTVGAASSRDCLFYF
jgi:hypothetical protein